MAPHKAAAVRTSPLSDEARFWLVCSARKHCVHNRATVAKRADAAMQLTRGHSLGRLHGKGAAHAAECAAHHWIEHTQLGVWHCTELPKSECQLQHPRHPRRGLSVSNICLDASERKGHRVLPARLQHRGDERACLDWIAEPRSRAMRLVERQSSRQSGRMAERSHDQRPLRLATGCSQAR